MNNRIRSYTTAMIAVFLLLWPGRMAGALTFQIIEGAGLASLAGKNPTLHTQLWGGIEAATSQWSGLLTNDVTIVLQIDWGNLGTPLASTSAAHSNVSYANYRNALLRTADPTSAVDAAVAGNLPAGAPTYALRNSGVTVANGNIRASQALLKALGFATSPLVWDGSIALNSRYTYDFERSDGIASNRYDFEGILTHEIGHVLGFSSAVDSVDGMTSGSVTPAPMDLWRFSEDGRDLSADSAPKWFSLDGSETDLYYSTGVRQGDGRQASHWRAGTSGLMRPETGTGQVLTIESKDLAVLDAIGWNVRAERVTAAEPASLLLMAACIAAILVCKRKIQ